MRMKCPHCGVSGRAASSTRGRLVRCPRCTELFLLPESDETRPIIAPEDQIQVTDEVLASALHKEADGEGIDKPHEIFAQTESGSIEDDVLVDESWLTDSFFEDESLVEPDRQADLSGDDELEAPDLPVDDSSQPVAELSPESDGESLDWNDDFSSETGEVPEEEEDLGSMMMDEDSALDDAEDSEELAFDETFGEELAESFEYEEITGSISDEENDGAPEANAGGEGHGLAYPDFSETQVNWKDEQQKTAHDDAEPSDKEMLVAGDVPAPPSQPTEEVIQQELGEMLATTCVACDNRVEGDELYCPDCMKKKESGISGSTTAMDDSTGENTPGKKKKGFWVRIALLTFLLLVLIGFLLFQMGLI